MWTVTWPNAESRWADLLCVLLQLQADDLMLLFSLIAGVSIQKLEYIYNTTYMLTQRLNIGYGSSWRHLAEDIVEWPCPALVLEGCCAPCFPALWAVTHRIQMISSSDSSTKSESTWCFGIAFQIYRQTTHNSLPAVLNRLSTTMWSTWTYWTIFFEHEKSNQRIFLPGSRRLLAKYQVLRAHVQKTSGSVSN